MDVKRWLRRVDDFQQRHAVVGFPLAVLKKFGDDQAGNLAALIAYYAFFSIFPLLLVLVTVLGIVLRGDPSLQDKVVHSALTEFPVIGDQLKSNVHSLNRTGVGLIIGLIGTFWGARGVANAAQNAFNSVWEVPYKDRPGFPKNQLRAIAMICVVGLGVLVTTALSSLGGGTGSAAVGIRVGAIAVALVLNFLLFWLGFRLATASVVTWREFVVGAALAAVVWQILQAVGGYLVAHILKNSSGVYGVFGLVLGLLSWLYLQAQFTIYAVEIDVVRHRKLWPRSMFPPPLTRADERAYQAYADVEERRHPQEANLEINEPVRRPGEA
jgi:inner membrane protein YhjD